MRQLYLIYFARFTYCRATRTEVRQAQRATGLLEQHSRMNYLFPSFHCLLVPPKTFPTAQVANSADMVVLQNGENGVNGARSCKIICIKLD